MEAIGLFSFLVMCVIGLVLFLAIMKIFSISHDMGVIKKQISDFTKYYYDLQKFKISKDNTATPQTLQEYNLTKLIKPDKELLQKPIDEKLTQAEYNYIFEHANNKFMDIANHFYKIDKEFYNSVILPVFEQNKNA